MDSRLDRIRDRVASRPPESLLAGGFALLILIGALLLWLPVSHHGRVGPLEALFTATSAVCVTGLVVLDTGTDFTLFGQVVILLLIQAGGIGVMAFAALALELFGRRLSLRAQAALAGAMIQREAASELGTIFRRILRFVILIEALGATILFVAMVPSRGAAHSAWSAVFHAISAFCNAGFSLYADSLTGLRANPVVLLAVMLLIVLGGIGHPVAVELWERLRRLLWGRAPNPSHLSMGSRVALWTSVGLILAGFLLLLGLGLTGGEGSLAARVSGALFQSVSARTAGFNTVDIGQLPLASLFILVVLMFIGGSPGSCAGGIKTTTFALWLAQLRGLLRGEKAPRLFDRHIPGQITRRAALILGLSLCWNLLGVGVLLGTEQGTPGAGMHDVLFEQVSAFGTVGLSTGLTPRLSVAGKLWIIATMYVGRLGPLTLAIWALVGTAPRVRYPEGRLMIG